MFFLRNKEIRVVMTILVFVSVILTITGFIFSLVAGILILVSAIIYNTIFFIHTRHRYRNIADLSEYLRRISAGEVSLDIRDNREGELSILKNDIYKVTLMLAEYNEQLKREKILLSDNMADISHQLKTPLTSMMVMSDLLRSEALPSDKRREFTGLIYAQLERMEWLVSSLLKMSKLEAGVIKMKQDKIVVCELIEAALKPLLIAMEIKSITYTFTSGHEIVLCDINWTREALVNVLKNCVEYTPQGGVIEVSVIDNPIYLEIKITDNGSGISKEDLPHIFTRFYRGKNAHPDSVGIGLAMSRSILRSQQGDITVKSEPGKGTTFAIHLYKVIV